MKIHYMAAAQTDIGLVKQVNQDSLTVKVVDTPLGEVALAVICDGMGGLTKGELASAIVVRAFETWFMEKFPYQIKGITTELLKTEWERLVTDCNRKICMEGSRNMGTTLTAMLFYAGCYYVIHVGDCRAYELTSEVFQLTKDQTFIEREVASGRMTREQAMTDSRRNVLLQCIGVKEEVEPEFVSGKLVPGACYLLCSDGFRHEVSREEILAAVEEKAWEPVQNQQPENKIMDGMQAALDMLIEKAKERGERDNISGILIQTLEEEAC